MGSEMQRDKRSRTGLKKIQDDSRSPVTPPADDHDPEKSRQIPPLHIPRQIQVFLIRQVSGFSLDCTRKGETGFLFFSGEV